MNTIENNKMIAEFMGLEMLNDLQIKTPKDGGIFLSELKYHTSWDWLMPVIKKIKLMGVDLETWRMITNPSDPL